MASCKRQGTSSIAIQVGYNRLGLCSSRSRSVTSGHIVIDWNNYRPPTMRDLAAERNRTFAARRTFSYELFLNV